MIGRTPRLLGATLAVALSGCTLEPHYHRPASPVPALQADARRGTAAADIGWREFFPDPQLQQLIALALANNRDLRVAALNVESAQAQYRIQRASLFPTIDASATEQVEQFRSGVLGGSAGPGGGSEAVSTGGSTLRFYDVGIGFTSYELDFFGRIRSLSYLTALVQQVSPYNAQQQLLTVRLLRLQNLVTLYKALGGGLLAQSAGSHTPPEARR